MTTFITRLAIFFAVLCCAGVRLAAETLDAAGTIHLDHPRGQVYIEAWEQGKVEITVAGPDAGNVKSERHGDEIVISTQIPVHAKRNWELTYTIKAPRDSKIVVDRGVGGVYVNGIAGDIDASVRHGQITLGVPENSEYKVEAHAKLGDVYSELKGEDKRRHLFNHDFAGGADNAAHKLNLRDDCGDIVIQKSGK